MPRFAASALLCTLCFVVPAAAVSASPAEPSKQDTDRAKALYDEGRKAYRRGDVEGALELFNEAYDLTELPTILYNIGLTYTRIYTTSNEVEHLRRALVVLENFRIQVLQDPGLLDINTVELVIAEVTEKIKAHEAGAAKPHTGDPQTSPEVDGPPAESNGEAGESGEAGAVTAPSGEAPPQREGGAFSGAGGKFKLAGIGLMGGGGAAAIGGLVGALVMQKRYFKETDLLDQATAESEAAGCPGAGGTLCDDYSTLRRERTDRANAYRRNIGLIGGTLGGVGAALIGTGVALYFVGKKKDSQGPSAHVVPTWGGAAVVGRF